jgi:hypothetical protein
MLHCLQYLFRRGGHVSLLGYRMYFLVDVIIFVISGCCLLHLVCQLTDRHATGRRHRAQLTLFPLPAGHARERYPTCAKWTIDELPSHAKFLLSGKSRLLDGNHSQHSA